jgi:hypothetical protein
MIITKLLTHQWKEKVRSSFWQRSIWLNILLGIMALYLILCVISIGFFADKIVSDIYKDRNVIQAFTGMLFYYFSFDLIFRFLMQKVPVISMQPYLTLPVRKSTLIHYPLIRTIPGFFNLLAMCLVLPFYFKVVLPSETVKISLVWLLTVFSLIGVNNFLGFFLKKYFAQRPLLIFLILALIASSFYLDMSKIMDISGSMAAAFIFIEGHHIAVIIPPMLVLGAYALAYNMLKRNSYIEEEKKRVNKISPGFTFLSKYGETGILMQNELRMILRNKRPKSIVWLSIIFLFYGFLFYNPTEIGKPFFMIFAGFFVTSAAGILYGQYFFAWESSFIDIYLANRVNVLNYMKSKYWLFFVLCSVCYVVTLPYGLFGHNIVLINLAFFIYNVGFTSFIYIFFGLFSRSRIDLGKSQFMNYEGAGAAQWLSVIPIMGIPFLIYGICVLLGNPTATYYIVMVLGLLGVIFNEFILTRLVKLFLKNKYKMAAAFRK